MTDRPAPDPAAHTGVAIIGASVAGVAVAHALRRNGYPGTVTLLDAQEHAPYDRPPLSKRLLTGIGSADVPLLRAPDYWMEQRIDLRVGTRVQGLDAARRTLHLAGGEALRAEEIVIAAGAVPRPLPFPSAGVPIHELRSLDDAFAVRDMLATARSMTIVGAGFIGLEVASAARARGIAVTIVEADPSPLERTIGAPAAEFVLAAHAGAGAALRTGRTVRDVTGTGSRATVRLSDGETIVCDAVLAGIGVVPHTSWLDGSGLRIDDGIVTDESLATDQPGVYACGDIARWNNPIVGRHMRIEHWTTAREQGAHLGAMLAERSRRPIGTPAQRRTTGPAFAHVPYAWSDQLGFKLQFVGTYSPGAVTTVEKRDAGVLVTRHWLGHRLIGATTIGAPREAMDARRRIRAESHHAASPAPLDTASYAARSDTAAYERTA